MRACPPLALAAITAFATLTGACATTTTKATTPVDLPTLRIVAEPVGPDALEVYDAQILFDRGMDLLDGGAWVDAIDYFDRLIREFPGDLLVVLAHYNRGVALIHAGRGDDAVVAFDAYLASLPETANPKDRLDGRFKRGQALAVAKRYEEVVELFDTMLGEDLSPDDRVEALIDAGVGHYMLGLEEGGDQEHRPTAEYRFLEARRILKKESERRRMSHMQFFQAQSAFYLAELAHLEFTEFKLTWPEQEAIAAAQKSRPDDSKDATLESMLGAQLEEKCQKLLRAQYQYLRTIREGHPGWASAAGYNVGRMYEELHHEMIGLPAPSDLTPDQASLYGGLVRSKVLILLEKAEKTYAQTADMVVRTGAQGEWGEKTRLSLERIRSRITEEVTAVAALDDDTPIIPVADTGVKGKGAT
jgi:pentatricopeptide repeat protein